MNDRELLELVAQVEGYDTTHSMNAQRLLLDPPVIALLIRTKDRGELLQTAWNPLESKDGAFQLMVAHGMKVDVDLEEGCTRILDEFNDTILRQMHFAAGPEEATRRAIVRAVALEATP